MNRFWIGRVVVAGWAAAAYLALPVTPALAWQDAPSPATPAEIVATYNSLADGILALKRTEENLCRSILAAANAQPTSSSAGPRRPWPRGDAKAAARRRSKSLAADVGADGDRGGQRGGRHPEAPHRRRPAPQRRRRGPGRLRRRFRDRDARGQGQAPRLVRVFAQLARAPKADAVDAEWKKVQAVVQELLEARQVTAPPEPRPRRRAPGSCARLRGGGLALVARHRARRSAQGPSGPSASWTWPRGRPRPGHVARPTREGPPPRFRRRWGRLPRLRPGRAPGRVRRQRLAARRRERSPRRAGTPSTRGSPAGRSRT